MILRRNEAQYYIEPYGAPITPFECQFLKKIVFSVKISAPWTRYDLKVGSLTRTPFSTKFIDRPEVDTI